MPKFSTLDPQRQVQLIIGPVIVIFSILAIAISVWFALVPVLLGVGLTRAGITGVCPLEKLLQK